MCAKRSITSDDWTSTTEGRMTSSAPNAAACWRETVQKEDEGKKEQTTSATSLPIALDGLTM